MATEILDDWIHLRTDTDLKERFQEQAEAHDRQTCELLREFMRAYIENRLIIKRDPNKETYYVD